MNLSIIYCFKDRELTRVKRSIESIYYQLGSNDEIIFVDYGSESSVREEIESYLKGFDKIKYIFVESQGWLWNRSHALNIGVKNANNEYVVMADIDLVFSSNFLRNIRVTFENCDLINYQCHYLPQGFNNYNKLFKKAKVYRKRYKKSSVDGLGLMAVKKTLFEKIHGYDEYYRVWGMEDNDIVHRFGLIGIQTNWLDIHDYEVFHQWHPSSGIRTRDNTARGWQKQMGKYFSNQKEIIKRKEDWGENVFREDFLKKLHKPTSTVDLSEDTAVYSAFLMKSVLKQHKPDDIIKFMFTDENIKQLRDTKSFKFMQWFNEMANRLKLPFVLESELYYFGNMDSACSFRDVFHYFILENTDRLEDYYLSMEEGKIELTIKK